MADELPEDIPEEITEPTATSKPPEGVQVGVDTPFGPNVAMPPARIGEKTQDGPAQPSVADNEKQGGSIKIPIWIFFFLLIALLAGSFFAGTKLSKKVRSQATQTVEGNSTTKNYKKSDFIPDYGLFRKVNETDAWTLLESGLQLAHQKVFVITDSPGETRLLSVLNARKLEEDVPIFILTGKETDQTSINKAKEAGFQVWKIESTLERPYTIVLLDNKLVLDISRSHWLWGSKEPAVLQNVTKWATEILNNATLQ